MKFEWNEIKAKANLKDHEVSFEEAKTVLFDDASIELFQIVDGEERILVIGMSARYRVLVVGITFRDGDNIIRIITARKAGKSEIKDYWSQ